MQKHQILDYRAFCAWYDCLPMSSGSFLHPMQFLKAFVRIYHFQRYHAVFPGFLAHRGTPWHTNGTLWHTCIEVVVLLSSVLLFDLDHKHLISTGLFDPEKVWNRRTSQWGFGIRNLNWDLVSNVVWVYISLQNFTERSGDTVTIRIHLQQLKWQIFFRNSKWVW